MNEFDQYRDLLSNHPTPVDTDRLWANIDAELRPTGQRRFGFWLFAGLLGLLFAGLGFWMIERQSSRNPVAAEQAQNARATEPRQASVLAEKAAPASLPEANSAASANAASQNFSEKTAAPQAKHSGQTARGGAFHQTANAPEHASRSASNLASPETGQQEKAADNQAVAAEILPEASPAAPARPKARLAEIGLLEIPIGQLAEKKRSIAPKSPCAATPDQPCYRFSKNKSRLAPYAGVYIGAAYPLRTLEAKTAPYNLLADRRKATETTLEAVQLGGFLGLELSQNWFAEAGLEYQRIAERFDYQRRWVDTVGKIYHTVIIINATGDTTFTQDSIFQIRTTTNTKQLYNRYTTLSVPLAIGYTFSPSAKLKIYGKAGVQLNLSFAQHATILDPNSEPKTYDSDAAGDDHPFRTKLGIAPFLTVGGRYGLTPRLELFGELRYLHHTSNFDAEAYPIRQAYGLPGMNFGLRLRL